MGETKKAKFIIGGLVVIVLLGISFLVGYLVSKNTSNISIKYEKPSYVDLNKDKIECYDNALYSILNLANIRPGELSVQSVRCSNDDTFWQRELVATYFKNDDHSKAPVSLYFQSIVGGKAPSGADGYSETCLIIDGKKVISTILLGRESVYKSEARCSWQNKL